MTADYLEDVLVRSTHHSSAIEGNTITLPETATIILNNTLPNNANISRREFYEVDNHQQTFEYVIHKVENNEKLTVAIVKDIHEKLTDRLQHDKGFFKRDENFIKGADFSTAAPELVPQLMEQLVGNLNDRLENNKTDDDKLRGILGAHIQFEKVHPFSGGNGRTGRMVMNYSFLENDLPPIIIKKHDKNVYMQILGEAQMKECPSNQNIENFSRLVKPMMEEEKKRMVAFAKQNEEKVVEIEETEEEVKRRERIIGNRRDE